MKSTYHTPDEREQQGAGMIYLTAFCFAVVPVSITTSGVLVSTLYQNNCISIRIFGRKICELSRWTRPCHLHFWPCAARPTTCQGISLLLDWVNVSSPYGNPFENVHWCCKLVQIRVACFVVASWVFLFSRSCSHTELMICCLFSVADRATLWAGCRLERVRLWLKLARSTVFDVLVELCMTRSTVQMWRWHRCAVAFRTVLDCAMFGHWIINITAQPLATFGLWDDCSTCRLRFTLDFDVLILVSPLSVNTRYKSTPKRYPATTYVCMVACCVGCTTMNDIWTCAFTNLRERHSGILQHQRQTFRRWYKVIQSQHKSDRMSRSPLWPKCTQCMAHEFQCKQMSSVENKTENQLYIQSKEHKTKRRKWTERSRNHCIKWSKTKKTCAKSVYKGKQNIGPRKTLFHKVG